mgnify:CR=1 FL=1
MEILQRRKFCREFLNGYIEKLHPQIISKVFEIGLLTLKSKYNKLLFSPEELDEIIMDLSGKKYVEIVPFPPRNHIKKIPAPKNNLPLQPKEDIYFHTENNNSELYTTKIIKNQKLYEKTLKNPNFSTQNSEIYPNWWWNNKEEEDEEKRPKSNINIVYNEDNMDDENNNNILEYFNESEANEDVNYQNHNKENESSKNYTIKKLTMNSSSSKRNNRYGNNDEIIYHEKPKVNNIPFNLKNNSFKSSRLNKKNIPNQNQKREIKQRVNSLKNTNRNNLSNINNHNAAESYNKKFKISNNISQGRKNPKISKIPKYKYTYVNGKVLRIPEENNSFSNIPVTKVGKY